MSRSRRAYLLYGFKLPARLDTKQAVETLWRYDRCEHLFEYGYCGDGGEGHLVGVMNYSRKPLQSYTKTVDSLYPSNGITPTKDQKWAKLSRNQGYSTFTQK